LQRLDDATVGYPRVLVFARGGHYVHRSHTDIVASSVVQLMKHVSHDDDVTAAVPHLDAKDQTSSHLWWCSSCCISSCLLIILVVVVVQFVTFVALAVLCPVLLLKKCRLDSHLLVQK